MAINEKINIEVTDGNTLKSLTAQAKELKRELTGIQNLAGNLFSKGIGRGAAAGAMRRAAAMPGLGDQDYDVARSAVGTGAASRDFAKQSQGLGGLVRVYATFAANLFAATAAFNALSNAADTTNMVRGLDQLGIASGKNLVQMSKQLAESTDYAISMREAMTAVAQASSSGMSDANIKRLGVAAKGASVALGIAMPDAINRLSRGIVKIEPELLDELGIFVRVDKAAEDYARTIGKSASQLTEFERRQAFANAVLDQAQQKFGDIKISTNPYERLLSSLKNVAQSGLEVVNKVLGPLIDALASSPTALGVALAGISAVLLRQALPALVSFRSNLRAAEKESADAATALNADYKAYLQFTQETAKKAAESQVGPLKAIADQTAADLRKTLQGGFTLTKGTIYDILQKGVDQLTPGDINKLQRQVNIWEGVAKSTKASDEQRQAAQANAQAVKDYLNLLPQATKAVGDYNSGLNAATQTQQKSIDFHGKMLQRVEQEANTRAKLSNIVAQAYDDTRLLGVSAAWEIFTARMEKARLEGDKFSKTMLTMRAAAAVTTAAVGTMFAAFGNIISAIGIVTVGIGMLSTVLGKNEKQAAEASKSLSELSDQAAFLNRVLDSMSTKTPLQQFSVESIAARTNAMQTLGQTMLDAIRNVDKEVNSRNWFDSLTNWLYGTVSKDTESKLAKELADGTGKAIDAARTMVSGQQFLVDIGDMLGIAGATATTQQFEDAMRNANKEVQKLVSQKVDQFSKSVNIAAQNAKALVDQFKELYKQYDDVVKSVAGESELSRLAVTTGKNLTDLAGTVRGELEPALGAISKLIDDPKFLRLFDQKDVQTVIDLAMRTKDIQAELADNLSKQKQITDEIEKQQQIIADAQKKQLAAEGPIGNILGLYDAAKNVETQARSVIDGLQGRLSELKLNVPGLKKQFDDLSPKLGETILRGFNKQVDIVFQQITLASERARINISKGFLQGIEGTKTAVTISNQLDQRAIQLDLQQLKASEAMITALFENTLALKENTANAKIRQIKEELQKQGTAEGIGTGQNPAIAALNADLAAQEKIVSDVQKIGRTGLSKITPATIKGLALEDPGLANQLLGQVSQLGAIRTQQQLKAGEAVTRAFQAELENLRVEQTNKQKQIDTELAQQQNKLELLSSQITDPQQRQRETQLLVDRIKELQLEAAKLPGEFAITAAERTVAAAKEGKIQGVTGAKAEEGLAEIKQAAKLSADKAKAELDGAAALKKQRDDIDIINYQAQKIADAAEMRYKFDEQTERLLQQELTASENLLEVKNNMGLLTADEYLVAKNLNQLQAIDRQYNQDLLSLNKQRADALADINKQLAIAIRLQDFEEQKRLGVKVQDLVEYYNAEFALLERSNQAKLEATRLGQYQDSRTEKYAQAFKNAFKSMEDAIVEFTKTGKLSFKSMINTFIEELLRYEIQQQQAFFIKGLGGLSGIASMFLGSLGLGGPTNIPGGFFATDTIKAAKGGAFDGKGMTSYAHGGMFTNRVVEQPTMFSFANGGSFGATRLGQMGEAGPEAVMPLVRNSNGDLAVHTVDRQSNVAVVVNNYTQAKAETKESVDSRGNRRIEVTIADMVSGEMTRNGSNIQSAFANSFGAKPLVARR